MNYSTHQKLAADFWMFSTKAACTAQHWWRCVGPNLPVLRMGCPKVQLTTIVALGGDKGDERFITESFSSPVVQASALVF